MPNYNHMKMKYTHMNERHLSTPPPDPPKTTGSFCRSYLSREGSMEGIEQARRPSLCHCQHCFCHTLVHTRHTFNLSKRPPVSGCVHGRRPSDLPEDVLRLCAAGKGDPSARSDNHVS